MKKLIFISILIAGCSEGYITDRDYPRMKPLQATRSSATTANVSVEIYYSSVAITDHGFVYSSVGFPTMTNGTKISLGPKAGTGRVTQTLSGLKGSTEYYVRAYAVCEGHVVFSSSLRI